MSKVLIYSDVHGNLPAFETMLNHAGRCDSYVCLGDLVNYGPWSNECVDIASSLPNSILLMGNHEEAFIAGAYPGNNSLVQLFFQTTYKDFSRNKVIKGFKNEYCLDHFILKHTIDNQYIYPDTTLNLDFNYVVGHSHHQFEYHDKNFTLYNAGSVGQNRMFINVINYIIYDSEHSLFSLENTPYDVDFFISELYKRNFPKRCIEYYLGKDRK